MTLSALEVVRINLHEIWDKGNAELVRTYCADPIVRQDANTETRLDHDAQVARIAGQFEELRPAFEDVVLAGDDQYVTSIWNATGADPNWRLCGIEVFKVAHGRITDVWNSTYMEGAWG